MSGKQSLKDTCLLYELINSLKQSILPITVDMKQLPQTSTRVWGITETPTKTLLSDGNGVPLVIIGE
jgi:hypothetical protein